MKLHLYMEYPIILMSKILDTGLHIDLSAKDFQPMPPAEQQAIS